MPSAPATITVGKIAKPSKPSVRFTALLEPTTTKKTNGRNNHPRSTTTFFKNGKESCVSAEDCAVKYKNMAVRIAMTACQKNFHLGGKPLEFFKINFR